MVAVTIVDIVRSFLVFTAGFGIVIYAGMELDARIRKKKGRKFESRFAGLVLSSTDTECAKNILLYPGSNKSSDIDIAFATTKGNFCIECKHRKADIHGGETFDTWASNVPVENPFDQNRVHMERLRSALQDAGIPTRSSDYYNIFATNMDVRYRMFADELSTEYYNKVLKLPGQRAIMSTSTSEIKKSMAEYFHSLPDRLTKAQATEINDFLWDSIGTRDELKEHARRVSLRAAGHTQF